jgi:hypothetical protein
MNLRQILMVCTVLGLWVTQCDAQELTPRIYWPAPKDTKVLAAGYSYSEGGVIFDPSIPISRTDSKINTGVLAYMQTLGLWGRTSNLLFELPYSWGTTKGLVDENPARRDFSNFGDLGVSLNVNLRGAPSMTLEDFLALRANPHTIIGAGLKIVAPTGHYDSDRLINVGTNRWVVRARVGSIIPLRSKWMLELAAGVWIYGDDDDFLVGKREQEPVYFLQTNLVKRFRPGLWASLDLTYFTGGRQTIGGERLGDTQQNVKIGGTIMVPFGGRHAIKIGYANGARTKYGNNFDQFLLSYQVLLN